MGTEFWLALEAERVAIGMALDKVDSGNRCGIEDGVGIRVMGGIGDGWLGGWGWLSLGLGGLCWWFLCGERIQAKVGDGVGLSWRCGLGGVGMGLEVKMVLGCWIGVGTRFASAGGLREGARDQGWW